MGTVGGLVCTTYFCYQVLVLFGTAGRQQADSRQAGITMTSNKTKIGRTLPRDRYRLL